MAVSSVKGCVSAGQEGNSYSQSAELRWDNKSVKQGFKYQVLKGKYFIPETLRVVVTDWCFHVSASFVEGSTWNAQPSAHCGPGQGVSCTLSFTHAPDEDSDQSQRPPGAHAAPGPLPSAARESIYQHFWQLSPHALLFSSRILRNSAEVEKL